MKEILFAHFQSLFERSYRDAFLENEGKIHQGGYMKEFHELAGISQLPDELTSSEIIFKDFKKMNAFDWLLLALV